MYKINVRSPLSWALSRQFVFNAPFQTGQFTTHAPAEDLAELWVTWTSGLLRIAVSRGSIKALRPWRKDTSRVVVTTDALTRVRGAVFEGIPASWLGSESQSQWHINRLELFSTAARTLACTDTHRHHVCGLVNKSPSGVPSRALCKQAADLLLWVDCHFLSIRAAHIPGLAGLTCCRGGDSSRRVEVAFGTSTGERRWICSPWARRRTACCSSPCLTPRWKGTRWHRAGQQPAVCVSSDPDIATGVIQDQEGVSFSDTHRPEPALVPRPDRTAGGTALADPHQEGFAIPGGWLGVAPEPGVVSLHVWLLRGYQRGWAHCILVCSIRSWRREHPLRDVCMP